MVYRNPCTTTKRTFMLWHSVVSLVFVPVLNIFYQVLDSWVSFDYIGHLRGVCDKQSFYLDKNGLTPFS